jgi:Site-specific recombinase XerD
MRATVRLQLRKDYVREDGKLQLVLRYLAHQKSSYIGLGISIYPKHWDKNMLMVRKGEPLSFQYNKIIRTIHERATGLILDNYNNPLPIAKFRELLFEKTESHSDFYDFITNELEFLQTDRRKGTIDNYKKLINTMKLWKSTLSFSEITLDYIQAFHKHEVESGNKLSTVYKKHANFKFLIGVAKKKELLTKNPYDDFEIKKKIKAENKDVLTEEEIAKLYDVYQSNVYEKGKQTVLRNFLFACYSGLSYAEYDIVTYADVRYYIVDRQECLLLGNERLKNNIPYRIPIVSDKVKTLLGSGEDFQKIFTMLTNQPTNRYLKAIMKEQGINKQMTFHRARHSFRTISARKGIQENIAERILGHADGNDIKDIYIHLRDEDIIAEMLKKWIA